MKGVLLFILILSSCYVHGQNVKSKELRDSSGLLKRNNKLDEVIVTGQFEPQSAGNSVYNVRTISSESIRQRNANNLFQVLNTEAGIRFSNDLALGTSDISLMGVSGKGVKILLDGIPVLDRGEIRESIGQIDINTVERIEIVEGPMSVSYGTDALGGVINIITKKASVANLFSVTARVQEESAGKEYSGFGSKGSHNQSAGLDYSRNGWHFSGSVSQLDFGGWKGQAAGRQLDWNPKNQLSGAVKAGYSNTRLNLWYRLNVTDETISLYGEVNPGKNSATDKDYISSRFFHQAQAEWTASPVLRFNAAASYTDYSRRTKTTLLNTLNGDRRLSPDSGSQDKSLFDHFFFRGTMQYKLSGRVSLQPGFEVNLNGSSGDRILGSPEINDYAFFIASELRISPLINIRPGIRMMRNSVYDAPPVIPSLNTLITPSKNFDMRLSYARGFRAPSLRELYFNFFDSSHSISGNTDLKAEYSNSINGSFTWHGLSSSVRGLDFTLSGFYNLFKDQIEIGVSAANPDVNSYINIGRSKTTGGSLQGSFTKKQFKGSLGFSYIGRYNKINEDEEFAGSVPEFVWSPEISSNIIYTISAIGTSVNLAYKFNGKIPAYEFTEQDGRRAVSRTETSSYNFADISINKQLKRFATLSAGVKNLFDVTRVMNTSVNTGSAHSAGGPVPVSYGRSFFMGLTFQWSKILSDNN